MGEIDIYGFRILVGAPCTVGLAMSSLGGPRYELWVFLHPHTLIATDALVLY